MSTAAATDRHGHPAALHPEAQAPESAGSTPRAPSKSTAAITQPPLEGPGLHGYVIGGGGPVRGLVVHGEIDLATATDFDRLLTIALTGAWLVRLDMTRVGFLGAGGIGLLAAHAARARQRGASLCVCRCSPAAGRALRLAGVTDLHCCHPDRVGRALVTEPDAHQVGSPAQSDDAGRERRLGAADLGWIHARPARRYRTLLQARPVDPRLE